MAAALPRKVCSTIVSPRLLGRGHARPVGSGRSAARPGAAKATLLRRSNVRQVRIRARKGTERPFGVGGSFTTLCHLQHGPIRAGPKHGIATNGPPKRCRPINHKVEPVAQRLARRASRPVRGRARCWSPSASERYPQPGAPRSPQVAGASSSGSRSLRWCAICMTSGASDV